jgi:hypothetical protein
MKGFKTVGFGLALVALAIFSNSEVEAFLSQHIDWYSGVVGMVVIGLRALTNSSVFQQDSE